MARFRIVSVNSTLCSFWMVLSLMLVFRLATAQDSNEDREVAIEKAKSFLIAKGDSLNFQVYFLESYLSRRFGSNFPELKKPEKFNAFLNDRNQMRFFRRLVDGTIGLTASEVDSAGSSIDRLTLRTLYCDTFPLDDQFEYKVKAMADKGGYYLTHALWSLQLAKENGCFANGNRGKLNRLQNSIADQVVQLIEMSDFLGDDEIEGISFLYCCGYEKLVKTEWINQIVFNQEKNGGWRRTKVNRYPHTKTTALALWALMESTYVANSNENWIPKLK